MVERILGTSGRQLQRSCDCGGGCSECSAEPRVQLSDPQTDGAAAASAPPVVDEVLRSPGAPLDHGTRGFMEALFAHDFRDVRLHSDAKAAESARAVNALAYTVGSNVVLGAGQHSPHTDAGRRLLAHELTHVVQQSGGLGRKVLQRWTINSCTQSQTVYVEDAFAKSFDSLSKATRRLEQKPTTDRVKQALWLAFRNDSEPTAETLRARINVLKEKITSASVTCHDKKDPSCATDSAYHSRGKEDYGEIYLCMPAFSDQGPVEQANTLTHEAAHKYLNVSDTGYFAKNCEETQRTQASDGTAGDNPLQRLNNADAYACFVHFLLRVGKEGLAKKAAEFKGDNLKIETGEAYVHTRTATPSRSTFRLTGVPTNSGFRAKWKLIASKNEFRVVSARSEKINTQVFDEDALEVYVPNDVRSRLEEKNIRTTMLRCDIQLFRPAQGQPDPPVITRTLEVSVSHGQDPFDTSRS